LLGIFEVPGIVNLSMKISQNIDEVLLHTDKECTMYTVLILHL